MKKSLLVLALLFSLATFSQYRQETWRVYHHFLWTTDPGFCGTEVLQIWPADENMQDGWRFAGDVTGRVLYDRDGQTFTASYHTLGRQTYTADSVFFGQRTNSDLFAAFSMPRHAEHARGYVAYTAAAVQSGYLLNSWCNYTHQQSLLQYPAVTAMEKRMTSAFGNTGAFYTVQHAITMINIPHIIYVPIFSLSLLFSFKKYR